MVQASKRRTKSYWEPFFDKCSKDFTNHSWDFTNQANVEYHIFNADKIDGKATKLVEDITFTNCDFRGYFIENRLIFKNCIFNSCDFGLSTFKKAKFSFCEFVETSYTQCVLEDTEFRDCSFKKIGISGNETNLDGTLITNPRIFIGAAFTNTSALPDKKSKFVQKMKLEDTKSTVARKILVTLTSEGSEKAYYDAIETSTLQECRARIALNLLEIRNSFLDEKDQGTLKRCFGAIAGVFKLFGGIVNFFILWFFGLVNAWGESLARPLILGAIILFAFGGIYYWCEEIAFSRAISKSTEIMLLFGYTNYTNSVDADLMSKAEMANALVGLFWYIVTVPTVVNKLTRIRG